MGCLSSEHLSSVKFSQRFGKGGRLGSTQFLTSLWRILAGAPEWNFRGRSWLFCHQGCESWSAPARVHGRDCRQVILLVLQITFPSPTPELCLLLFLQNSLSNHQKFPSLAPWGGDTQLIFHVLQKIWTSPHLFIAELSLTREDLWPNTAILLRFSLMLDWPFQS